MLPLGFMEPPGPADATIVKIGIVGAAEFGAVKNGTKLTVPKLKSFLKSKIDWLIACVSVVPHQLLAAFTLTPELR